MNATKEGPRGIGGWLAFLVASLLVIGPLFNIVLTYGDIYRAELEYPSLAQITEWSSLKIVVWIAVSVFSAISIYGGFGLVTKRTPDVVSSAKIVLWIINPIAVIVILIIIPAIIFPNSGMKIGEEIPLLIASLIAPSIWTAYLNRSKRVKNTYALNIPIKKTSSITLNSSGDKNDGKEMSILTCDSKAAWDSMAGIGAVTNSNRTKKYTAEVDNGYLNDDEEYRLAWDEITNEHVDTAIWSRAFSQTEGDNEKTKALYIKYRVEKLVENRIQKLAEDKQNKFEEEYGRAIRYQEQIKRFGYLPKLDENGLWTTFEPDGAVRKHKNNDEFIIYAVKRIAEIPKNKSVLKNLFIRELSEDGRFSREFSDNLQYLYANNSAKMMLNSIVQNQYLEVTKLLSKEPLLIAVTDADGNTPLHIAVRIESQEMTRYFLENGALVEVKNKHNVTPLEIAVNSRQDELVSLLTAHDE